MVNCEGGPSLERASEQRSLSRVMRATLGWCAAEYDTTYLDTQSTLTSANNWPEQGETLVFELDLGPKIAYKINRLLLLL